MTDRSGDVACERSGEVNDDDGFAVDAQIRRMVEILFRQVFKVVDQSRPVGGIVQVDFYIA